MLFNVENAKADAIKSAIFELKSEISRVTEQVFKIDEMLAEYHEIASCDEGQSLDTVMVQQAFKVMVQLENGKTELNRALETFNQEIKEQELKLSKIEREKLKYEKLLAKHKSIQLAKLEAHEQSQLDNIATTRFFRNRQIT